jgi:hypothetical protein
MIARTVLCAVGALAALSSTVIAGIGTPTARVELRIVPQRGLPGQPGGVSDLPTTEHDAITVAGDVRRFEVQYRIVDLITADGLVPAGLRTLNLRIDAAGPSLGGGTLRRAALSRFEAELAGPTPPVTPDVSGLPTGGAASGLHRPLRDALLAPGDTHPANGLFTTGPGNAAIIDIIPLSLAATGQADAWFGLYSFDLIAENIQPGTVLLTATAVADSGTGTRFSYWAAGQPSPRFSPAATAGSASVVSVVPSPGAAGALLVLGVATARRRAR